MTAFPSVEIFQLLWDMCPQSWGITRFMVTSGCLPLCGFFDPRLVKRINGVCASYKRATCKVLHMSSCKLLPYHSQMMSEEIGCARSSVRACKGYSADTREIIPTNVSSGHRAGQRHSARSQNARNLQLKDWQ